VAELTPGGSALVYSTYFGGSGGGGGNGDGGASIAVDAEGSAYVTGFTNSTDFPVVNPVQPTSGGRQDAFVAKFAPGTPVRRATHPG
jgi:hypothetical protein